MTDNKKVKLLIGITGSVACIKLPMILENFKNSGKNIDICLIYTENSLNFIDICNFNEIPELSNRLAYLKSNNLSTNKNCIITFSDNDEWLSWRNRNDPVLHIELRKWADAYLIAPLDANTLAKLSNGLCDNLITCVARAWDFNKPIIICPAMNTFMYEHPLTRKQLDILRELGYFEIKSIEKLLMCGDYGNGAMAHVDDICRIVMEKLAAFYLNKN